MKRRKPSCRRFSRDVLFVHAISSGYAIEYDGGGRHCFGGRRMPWASEWAAQRFLRRNPSFLARGGRVV